MSETPKKLPTNKVLQYNAKSTYYPLPHEVLTSFPRLSAAPDTEEFRLAVLHAQGVIGLFPHECDGMLGWQTFTRLLRHCNRIDSEYVVIAGRRCQLPQSHDYKLISFDEAGGKDLHPFGHFSQRQSEIKGICLHWGGLDADHCFNVFANGARKVSSHFLIGLDAEGRAIVYQTLDINHKAWHGGWVNDFTVGVDICQASLPQWERHYAMRGVYEVEEIDNPTPRGPSRVLSLDERLATAASAFIKDLSDALNILVVTPENHEVYKGVLPFSVFGHHHVNERKFDVACWWPQLFPKDTDDEM